MSKWALAETYFKRLKGLKGFFYFATSEFHRLQSDVALVEIGQFLVDLPNKCQIFEINQKFVQNTFYSILGTSLFNDGKLWSSFGNKTSIYVSAKEKGCIFAVATLGERFFLLQEHKDGWEKKHRVFHIQGMSEMSSRRKFIWRTTLLQVFPLQLWNATRPVWHRSVFSHQLLIYVTAITINFIFWFWKLILKIFHSKVQCSGLFLQFCFGDKDWWWKKHV